MESTLDSTGNVIEKTVNNQHGKTHKIDSLENPHWNPYRFQCGLKVCREKQNNHLKTNRYN
jgi:hypothetical protein